MFRVVPHTWRSCKIVTPWHQIRYLHTWHIFTSKQIIKVHLGNVFIVGLCYDLINPAIKMMIMPQIYMTSLFQSACRSPGNYLMCVYCHKIICGRQEQKVMFPSSWLVPYCREGNLNIANISGFTVFLGVREINLLSCSCWWYSLLSLVNKGAISFIVKPSVSQGGDAKSLNWEKEILHP